MKSEKYDLLKLAFLFIIFILGLYCFAYEYFEDRDYDACALYVAAVSVFCVIPSLILFNLKMLKRVIVTLGVLTLIVLTSVYVLSLDEFQEFEGFEGFDTDLFLSRERKIVLITMLFVSLVHFTIYKWIGKREKELNKK